MDGSMGCARGLVDSGAVGGYRAQGFVVAPTFGPQARFGYVGHPAGGLAKDGLLGFGLKGGRPACRRATM
jgi:hypothetical protein